MRRFFFFLCGLIQASLEHSSGLFSFICRIGQGLPKDAKVLSFVYLWIGWNATSFVNHHGRVCWVGISNRFLICFESELHLVLNSYLIKHYIFIKGVLITICLYNYFYNYFYTKLLQSLFVSNLSRSKFYLYN